MITDIEEQLGIIRGFLWKDCRSPCVDELSHSIPKLFCMDMNVILLDASGKEYKSQGKTQRTARISSIKGRNYLLIERAKDMLP